MPVGYLLSVLVLAIATFLALWPRATNGPRATPAFVIESLSNEAPFLVFFWLVAATVLAFAQHDIDSPAAATVVALAGVTTIGLVAVVGRARRDRPVLDAALAGALGAGARIRGNRGLGRALLGPLPVPAPTVRRRRNVAYGPAGRFNRLDVYTNRSRPTGCPTLVYFHPGGFFRGSKDHAARPVVDRLVRHGWVCVNANYRLGAAGGFPNHLVDAKRAIAWTREHSDELGADPHRIVVAGGSAGANLAAMCALTADQPGFQPGFERADTSVAAAVTLYGYYGPSGDADGMPSAPGDYVRADAPPFLVVHGAIDPMASVEAARRFAHELDSVSTRPVVYAELPGAQHNFDLIASIRSAAVAGAIEAFAAAVLR